MQAVLVPLDKDLKDLYAQAVFLTHALGMKGRNNLSQRHIVLEGEKASGLAKAVTAIEGGKEVRVRVHACVGGRRATTVRRGSRLSRDSNGCE